MSATNELPLLSSPGGTLPLRGVSARSTSAVRTRYRRQTAALMIGTTVLGLWLGLGAPAVSPVTPTTPPAVVAAADPAAGDTTTDLNGPAREAGQGGVGPQGDGGRQGDGASQRDGGPRGRQR